MLSKPKKRKISFKSCDCKFIGYAVNSVTYRFLVLRSDILNVNTIIESKSAEFFENVFPLKYSIRKSLSKYAIEPSSSENNGIELRRSKRDRKETNFIDDFYTFLVNGDLLTYSEAISSPHGPLWKEAINSEIKSIMSNHT